MTKKRLKTIICKVCNHSFSFENSKQKKNWTALGLYCPECNSRYCVMPETERELKLIQDQYLVNRDSKFIAEMYTILLPYAQSFIKQLIKRGKLPVPHNQQEYLDYHSHAAVVYMLNRYYEVEGFFIAKSFGGFLKHKIRQTVYGPTEYEIGDVSLNIENEDGLDAIPVGVHDSQFDDIEDEDFQNYTIKEIDCLLRNPDPSCSPRQRLGGLIALSLLLDSGDHKKLDRFLRKFPFAKRVFKKKLGSLKELIYAT